MLKVMKKNIVIKELKERGIHQIDGQPIESVEYHVLLKNLAIKRATEQ